MFVRFRENVIFLAPNWYIAPIFFVQIPPINEHLLCKYFVRLSVGNATKGFATYGCFHPCFLYIYSCVFLCLSKKYNFDKFWINRDSFYPKLELGTMLLHLCTKSDNSSGLLKYFKVVSLFQFFLLKINFIQDANSQWLQISRKR